MEIFLYMFPAKYVFIVVPFALQNNPQLTGMPFLLLF
jgi:hypothetical protein